MSKSRELHPVINFGLVPLLQLILACLVVGLLIVRSGKTRCRPCSSTSPTCS